MTQVIEGTRDVEAVLARVVAGPVVPPPPVNVLPGSEPPDRHASSPAAAAAPSGLRLPATIEAEGRRVRVALGAAEGWGRDSSSLIALPHGMEVHSCIATLSTHQAPLQPHGVSAGTRAGGLADAGRPEEGATTATALLLLICRSGKVLRLQARLATGGQSLPPLGVRPAARPQRLLPSKLCSTVAPSIRLKHAPLD